MRLTQILRQTADYNIWHGKYLRLGNGKMWGERKVRYSFTKDYKRMWKLQRNRKVFDATSHSQYIPANAKVEEATDVTKEHFNEKYDKIEFPWPYNKYAEGTETDPNYKKVPGLVFERKQQLVEGWKGASNFTNTVLMNDGQLPLSLSEVADKVDVSGFLEILDRKIHWSKMGDSALIKLPKKAEFPRVNFTPRAEVGLHPLRAEANVLRSFYDTSSLLASTKYGFADRRRIVYPYCVVPMVRDGHQIVLDVRAEFVATNVLQTLVKSSQNEGAAATTIEKETKQVPLPLFERTPSVTESQQLVDIKPVDWRINFEKSHFYTQDYDFSIPRHLDVQTIYFTSNQNLLKPQATRFMQGRGLIYCYAYAVAQARRSLGLNDFRDPSSYTSLYNPLTIQLAFYNHQKNSFGFVCFQLNTLSYDSPLKNQVWLEGPYDVDADRESILKKLVAIHLNGSRVEIKEEPIKATQAL
ncbi:hypothetical protein HDE_05336 [Halotydeus destructor]|nr:hypothetical protein HDE_05336 [Halotydeus destructor]